MKLINVTLLLGSLLFGQFNLQQHYDAGRQMWTSTAEFFSANEQDVLFTFIDINYDHTHFDKAGATDIWYEAAYYRPIPGLNGKLNATLQYNDGLYFHPIDSISIGTATAAAWLAGISYPLSIGTFVLPLDFLIRSQHGDDKLTFQLTGVWFLPLWQRFTLAGYIDVWTNACGPAVSLMAEPQAMVNFGQLSLGTELEISRGFSGAWTTGKEYFKADGSTRETDWWLIPTIFVKYTF